MSPSDILTRAARPPDQVLRYGPRHEQFADLRLPVWSDEAESSPGSAAEWRPEWPVVIFLHGGFWRAAYDRTHTGPLAEALAGAGFAVSTPEYRRTGQRGGGWPGTFDDVAAAVDALPELVAAAAAAAGGSADLRRVVLAGHSAGGHLALWAAGRGCCPRAAAGRRLGCMGRPGWSAWLAYVTWRRASGSGWAGMRPAR
jgi:acetyl esterase/lipase